MNSNNILIARMQAEFKEAVREINERAAEAQHDCMKAAWAALGDGDTAGRDISLEKALNIPEITRDAIVEAGIRIGKKYGLSENLMRAHIARMRP